MRLKDNIKHLVYMNPLDLFEKKNLRYVKSEMAFESGIKRKISGIVVTTENVKTLNLNQNQKVVRSCKLKRHSIKYIYLIAINSINLNLLFYYTYLTTYKSYNLQLIRRVYLFFWVLFRGLTSGYETSSGIGDII